MKWKALLDRKQFIETFSKELSLELSLLQDVGTPTSYSFLVTADMIKEGFYLLPADPSCHIKIELVPFIKCVLLDPVDSSNITYRIIEIVVGEGASVIYRTEDRLPDCAKKYQFFKIVVQKHGLFSQEAWQSGGLVQANAYRCLLQGYSAAVMYSSRVHAQGKERHQLFFSQTHEGSCSKSQVQVKAVVDGKSQCKYQGTISIKKDAVDSQAHQQHTALTLSPDAQVVATPNLEVLTNKVTCGHGAAIAHIDDNHLFYLRLRGIPLSQARALIVDSFLL